MKSQIDWQILTLLVKPNKALGLWVFLELLYPNRLLCSTVQWCSDSIYGLLQKSYKSLQVSLPRQQNNASTFLSSNYLVQFFISYLGRRILEFILSINLMKTKLI